MNSNVFDGVWEFGRRLTVFSPEGLESRQFFGFLEPMSLVSTEAEARRKPFVLPKERFRLFAHPQEDFFGGEATRLFCGGCFFEILSVKPVYFGEEISHRECVLLKDCEVREHD